MKALGVAGWAAFMLVVVGSPAFAGEACDEFDKRNYASDFYAKEREVTYWGRARFDIRDYQYGSGDAEYHKLTVRDKTQRFGRERPIAELQDHFLKEFRRLFGDLPFRDVDIGRDERWDRFYQEKGKEENFFEQFEAAEEARRRSLYGGRAAALYCNVSVKRRGFPVLYEIECHCH